MGESEKRFGWKYMMRAQQTDEVKEQRDLGVMIQDTLSMEKHVNMITEGTCRLLIDYESGFL